MARERDRHRTWRIILLNVAVAVCRIATRRVLDLGLFRVPERATHNAAMDSLPGLDLSLPPFDLLDDAGRRQLEASVDIGFHPAGTTLIKAGQDSPPVFLILTERKSVV